jgi:hypothetical protein
MHTSGPVGFPMLSFAGAHTGVAAAHPPDAPTVQRHCWPGRGPLTPTGKQAPVPSDKSVQQSVSAVQPKTSVQDRAHVFATPVSTQAAPVSQHAPKHSWAGGQVDPEPLSWCVNGEGNPTSGFPCASDSGGDPSGPLLFEAPSMSDPGSDPSGFPSFEPPSGSDFWTPVDGPAPCSLLFAPAASEEFASDASGLSPVACELPPQADPTRTRTGARLTNLRISLTKRLTLFP